MSSAAADYYFSLVEKLVGELRGDEILTSELRAEDSSFVRFNHAAAGQAGEVHQSRIDCDLIEGRRHARGGFNLTGDLAGDLDRARDLFDRLRAMRRASADDPYLDFNQDVAASSTTVAEDQLPSGDEVISTVCGAAREQDLVGIAASGGMHRGFANSLGQRNWHTSYSFNLDWSVFDSRGQAVKSGYAGSAWHAQQAEERIRRSREDLAVMAKPVRELAPGRYRAYLAPAALHELMGVLSWDGFGLRGWRTRTSPLQRLHDGEAELAGGVDLSEAIGTGVAPAFESSGFARPDEVALVRGGRSVGRLVSPRSAREFDEPTNGANRGESPCSLDMAGGSLDAEDVVSELHRGLLVSNFWYLNFSDRMACRTTGMTRFATMWVEDGVVQGPVAPMRFDDTVYRVLGSQLVDLTRQRDWILDPDTYEWRSTRSARLPGALVDDFTLTL